MLAHRMTLALLAFAIVAECGADTASAQIRFKHHFIDAAGPDARAWGTNVIADFDNDGHLDVVISKTKHGPGRRAVYWYRNLGAIDKWAAAEVLLNSHVTGCGGVALDVDRDGYMDFVATNWLRNPGKSIGDKPFTQMPWGCGPMVHDIEAVDLDNDGHPEIVANIQHNNQPGLHVFRAPADPTQPWKKQRVIASRVWKQKSPVAGHAQGDVHAAVSPRGWGDIDGDGDNDLVYIDAWAENLDGTGRKWKTHENLGYRPRGSWGAAVRCYVADINGDGHLDIVQSACDARGRDVVWLQNNGDGTDWKLNAIPFDGKPGDMHSLAVADFDLDGDLDVYVDEMEHLNVPASRAGKIGMIVWENLDGTGTKWKQHMLVTGIGGHQAQAADMDNDGDIDIVTRPYAAANTAHAGRMHVSILENLAKNPNATKAGSGFNKE